LAKKLCRDVELLILNFKLKTLVERLGFLIYWVGASTMLAIHSSLREIFQANGKAACLPPRKPKRRQAEFLLRRNDLVAPPF